MNNNSDFSSTLAMIKAFNFKRSKLLKSFVKDYDDFNTWTISAERLLAYYIVIRNLRKYGDSLKHKVKEQIESILEEDNIKLN